MATTVKVLDENGVKKVFSVVKSKLESGDTTTLSSAKSYTDQQIAAIPDYSLPVATTTTLGGVKAGGTGINIAADGTISATGTAAVDPTALPLASKTERGAVIIGTGIDVANGVISVSHPDVYTKTESDAKFQTEAQVQSIASAEVAKIVDGAPEAFDTLKEIADALNSDTQGGVVNSILTQIGTKANSADVYTKTETDSKISATQTTLQSAIDAKPSTSDVTQAKNEAILSAGTNAATLYQLKSEMPTFTAYTDTEIDALAAQVFV